jgi:hypothetical protein
MFRQQIFPFIFAQNTQSQADKGPQMKHAIATAVMLTEFMNLGMTIVTAGNTIVRSGHLNLSVFQPTEFKALLFVSGLQKTTPSAATVIIGPIGLHVDKVFLPHHGFYHKAQILGDGVSVAFAHNLARILDREFDLQILVPVRIDIQLSLPNPLGVVLINAFNLKFVGNIEFFQSCQD